MKEYHKIETLLNRDTKTFKVIIGEWRLPEFEYLKGNCWSFTEKVDGTNIRIIWDGDKVTLGGKTDNAQIPVFLIAKLQDIFPAIKFAGMPPLCLYGEGYGAKIQGGGNYIRDGVDFILFDVKIDEWWLQRKDVEDVANKMQIRIVPIIGQGTLSEAVEITRKGITSTWGHFQAEGIVVRPLVELKTRSGHRLIGKIKTKDF